MQSPKRHAAFETSAELRPRDRLLEHGPEAVSDAELLSVLLRYGAPGASTVAIAARLLETVGGLHGLLQTDRSLLERSGEPAGRSAVVLAAAEVARRVARRRIACKTLLDYPEAVVSYLDLCHSRTNQEVVGALFLDVRHRLIADRLLFRGTLVRTGVEPRQILAEGLRLNAASFVLYQTHPSGDPSPSAADYDVDQRLRQAGELVGIEMIDHLIIGSASRWVSMHRSGRF
ncbi:MAG: DNA repair protein RadC [Acidobacteriota bacterium]